MKYYAAICSKQEAAPVLVQPPFNLLMSYHYFKKDIDLVKSFVQSGYDVFLDSGAFSAETKGYKIDIDEYCNYIIETGCGLYAGLDVIGDSRKTIINIKAMQERYNLSPIPTFHIGSSLVDLYHILDYNHIAIGGLVFSSNIMQFCDEVWNIILKERPDIRVHAFGMSNLELIERYPWYSIDSSTYKEGRRFGRIKVLWDGLKWRTFTEKEYISFLKDFNIDIDLMSNKERYHYWDYFSLQQYKTYITLLTEINKYKSFDYLKQQLKFF